MRRHNQQQSIHQFFKVVDAAPSTSSATATANATEQPEQHLRQPPRPHHQHQKQQPDSHQLRLTCRHFQYTGADSTHADSASAALAAPAPAASAAPIISDRCALQLETVAATVFALAHKYVFVHATSSTHHTCLQLSHLLESQCALSPPPPLSANNSSATGEKANVTDGDNGAEGEDGERPPFPMQAYLFVLKFFGHRPEKALKMLRRLLRSGDHLSSPAEDAARSLVCHHEPDVHAHLIEHPHLLVEFFGADFDTLDEVATRNQWWAPCSAKQIRTFMHYHLLQSSDTGVYWNDGRIVRHARRDLVLPDVDADAQHGGDDGMGSADRRHFEAHLRQCMETYVAGCYGGSHSDADADAGAGAHHAKLFYSSGQLRDAEEQITRVVWTLDPVMLPDANDEPAFQQPVALRNTHEIPLDATQLAVVRQFLRPESVCLLVQGGAGTGKTQIGVCAVLQYAEQRRVPVAWCAPTHEATLNAQRRLHAYTTDSQVAFSTIHSFCGKLDTAYKRVCKLSARGRPIADEDVYAAWMRCRHPEGAAAGAGEATAAGAAVPRVLVVDECSMIPSLLLARVVQHVRRFRIRKVLLMGDRYQLEPVGAGKPFADLQDVFAKHPTNPLVPKVVTLCRNYRSDGLGIIELAQNVIDPHFSWTVRQDVADNPDVTFHATQTDAGTTATLARVLAELRTGHDACPSTALRVTPDPTKRSRSVHVITPNNEPAAAYASLVRQVFYGKTLPAGEFAVGDIVRFDTNRSFYTNGTLGTIVAIDEANARLLIDVQPSVPTASAADSAADPEPPDAVVGVLALCAHEPYLEWLWQTNRVPAETPTDAETWRDDYEQQIVANVRHPQFPSAVAHAHLYCTQHMRRTPRTTTTTATTPGRPPPPPPRDKLVAEVFHKAIDPFAPDIFRVCRNIVSVPVRAHECKLSYASTVHKAQGGEADYIVVVMPHSMRYRVNRSIAYTAFSRARKHLYLVGDEKAFQKCNQDNTKRVTMLPTMF